MNTRSIYAMKAQAEAGKEICSDNCVEVEYLFIRAQQVMTHYEKAMAVTAVLIDRTGKLIKAKNHENITQVCSFCQKLFHNSAELLHEKVYSCDKLHHAALTKSRHSNKSHVYFCKAGFAFWTSPIYWNKRYAGAVTAGKPLFYGREEATEGFRLNSKGKIATEKFKKMLADMAVKTSDEIQAMVRILELCAQEISERGGDLNKTIRRIARWGGETRGLNISVPENQIEKERELVAAFQRADNETGYKIINELIDGIYSVNPKNMEMKRIRAIELVVLLSRAAINPEASQAHAIHKANNKSFQRVKESKTVEELRENLRFAAEQMASEIFSFRGMRHASALRKAQSHIWKNLGRKVSLEEISKVAGLSAPYFSTIFKEEMGENFSSYINRLRVRKAAVLLKETASPIRSIAKTCGFEDQSWFSKIFKHYTGTTPGKYRETGSLTGSDYAS